MEAHQDGGGFDMQQPMSGLGNFKGVMLCNRPSDEPHRARGGSEGTGPFKSMVSATHSEQLGLPPCRSFEPTVKTRGPSAALRRHVRWLKELQEQMRSEREQVEVEEQESDERRQRMKAAFEKHRHAVRQMLQERNGEYKARFEAMRRQPLDKREPAAPARKKAASKPLWAMTEREKEDFEEEEAEGLINFAENLDFDKYVGDLEFRQQLEVLRDRAGKLQKEQDAFKDALLRDFNAKVEEDEEGRSTSAGSPRSSKLEDGVEGAGLLSDAKSEYSTSSSRKPKAEKGNPDGRPEWDRSTVCGDERPEADREVKETAQMILESAPQMRAIHSKDSIAKLVEKSKQEQLGLIETMRRDGPCPVPLIVASEDSQVRLNKPVNPSMLPYLYRSPAV